MIEKYMFLFVLYTSKRRETFVSVVPNLDKIKKGTF